MQVAQLLGCSCRDGRITSNLTVKKRIDDLRSDINERFDDLRADTNRAFDRIEKTLLRIEAKLGTHDGDIAELRERTALVTQR